MGDSNDLLIGLTNHRRKDEQLFYEILGPCSLYASSKRASLGLHRLTISDVLSHSTNNLCVNDVLPLVA